MFIRLYYLSICTRWYVKMYLSECLSLHRAWSMCMCMRVCAWVCLMFLLFVSEGHNENKIIMYVYYLIKYMHVCLIVPPSINEDILLVLLLLLIRWQCCLYMSLYVCVGATYSHVSGYNPHHIWSLYVLQMCMLSLPDRSDKCKYMWMFVGHVILWHNDYFLFSCITVMWCREIFDFYVIGNKRFITLLM